MSLTQDQLQQMANQQEQQRRDDEQKKYIELSGAAKMYKEALGNTIGIWICEEFDPDETEEEKKVRKAKENFTGIRTGDLGLNANVKEGVYTRKGADQGIVIEKNKESGGYTVQPHGDKWLSGFNEGGWREAIKGGKELLGADTFIFEIGDVGPSRKIFGFEDNDIRKLAIKQLEGTLELAQEQGIAIELGPRAKKLLAEISKETDATKKYKNKDGEAVHYRHYIEEKLQNLRDNRDYQNMKMGLGNEALQKFNKEVEPAFEPDKYIDKVVYQKLGKDGKPVPGAVEDNINLRAEAAEKAIKDLEASGKTNDDVIAKLDQAKDAQSKLINKSDVKEVLDKIKDVNASGKSGRLERDDAVSKLEKRNENDLQRIAKLEAQIKADNQKIKADANARGAAPASDLNEKEKEAIAKNEKSLESLNAMKTKIEEQKNKIKDGIKAWDKDGDPAPDGSRNKAIQDRKEKLDQRQAARPTNS